MSEKLTNALKTKIQKNKSTLLDVIGQLTSPRFLIEQKSQKLNYAHERLKQASLRIIKDKNTKLSGHERILQSLSPKGVLSRGYALIYDEKGNLLRQSNDINENQTLNIEFNDKDIMSATAGKKLKH